MQLLAKNKLLSNELDYKAILTLCDIGDWKTADDKLAVYIKQNADKPQAYAMAAHAILRQGNIKAATWLINKSQAQEPENIFSQIEDVCLNFYNANYQVAYQKLYSALLLEMPENHPIHFVATYLCCLYNDEELYKKLPVICYKELVKNYMAQNGAAITNSKDAGWNAVDPTRKFLSIGDKLFANITARFSEIFFAEEADSFFSLGLFNFSAGNYQNASRNFHEAVFRETNFMALAELHQFYLFCRLNNFNEAISKALKVEGNGNLDVKGQCMLIDLLLKTNTDINIIKSRFSNLEAYLKQNNIVDTYAEVIKLRLQIFDDANSKNKILKDIEHYIDKTNCPASLLCFYAENIFESNVEKAKACISRARDLELFLPVSLDFKEEGNDNNFNFEYAGLFIPKEHEGGAWPTQNQKELLNIIFQSSENEALIKWQEFSNNNSIYTLEAGASRLLPAVYKRLTKIKNKSKIPQLDILGGIWKKSYYENALKIKELFSLIDNLEGKGIKITLLKGVANIFNLYQDIGSRPMSDIDLLIDEKNVRALDTYLKSMGWVNKHKISDSRLRFCYATTYYNPNGTIIDIHWRPCESLNASFYSSQDLGEPHYVEYMGKKLECLSPTLNLFCTILHGVEWNHLSPVRWVSDSILLIDKFKNQIDWQNIYNLAIKYHCLPIIIMGLQYLQNYNQDFVKNLPKPLLKYLNNNYENDVLMKIRLQPKNLLVSFDEAYAVLQHYKKRFTFSENDYLFICGGDNPELVKSKCQQYGINWASHYDFQTMLSAINPHDNQYNLIAINANMSCLFQCFMASYN
jgi:hypothetical protein